MNFLTKLIFGVNLFFLHVTNLSGTILQQTHYLTSTGNNIFCNSENINVKIPSVYCYVEKKKEIRSIWKTVAISVQLDNDHFEQFDGSSPEEVMRNFKKRQSSWSANMFSFWKRKSIKLDPFNTTCIGVLTHRSYVVSLTENDFDLAQFFKFLAGMFLFLNASSLSQNQLFYYICCIIFGICGSILILVFLISRIFPNRSLMYGMAIGGWTLAFYFAQYLMDNAKLLFLQYQQYVLSYIGISGIISFAICYRFGPLTNPRSRNLIKWSLQITGLLLIFYSSYLYEVTYMVDLLMITSRILPFSSVFSGIRFLKSKISRPKTKLLTRKEYVEQGRIETEKALEELRTYCSSPEFNTWKTVLRLKNPLRFAEFMETSRHLSDEEIEEYGSLSIKPNGTIITDDSDSVAEFTEED